MKRIGMLLLATILLAGCSTTRIAGLPPTGREPIATERTKSDQVAFIRGGDLWVLPLGGSERKVTDGGGYSDPAFSASGDWILVRQGDQLFTVRTDGAGAKPLPVRGRSVFAAWSPAGDRIAYRTADRIGILDADGTHDRTLVSLQSREIVSRLAWSPDGKWIGYDLNSVPPGGAPGSGTPTGLRKVSPEGGDPITVFTVTGEAPQCLIMAGWSADSANMLFWPQPMCSGSLLADGTALQSVDAGGGTPQQLVEVMLTHPDFLTVAADGTLAVTAGPSRTTWNMKSIDTVRLGARGSGAAGPAGGTPGTRAPGAVATQITPPGTAAISPAWSPDGRLLAYSAMPAASPNIMGGDLAKDALSKRRIWLAESDGKNPRQLTDDAAFRDEAPSFTSSGSVLFARLTPENQASLWLIPAEGGRAAQVAQIDGPPDWFGFYGWIDWSQQFSIWTPAGK